MCDLGAPKRFRGQRPHWIERWRNEATRPANVLSGDRHEDFTWSRAEKNRIGLGKVDSVGSVWCVPQSFVDREWTDQRTADPDAIAASAWGLEDISWPSIPCRLWVDQRVTPAHARAPNLVGAWIIPSWRAAYVVVSDRCFLSVDENLVSMACIIEDPDRRWISC